VLYNACLDLLQHTGWPRASIFAVTAVLMLPVAILYRPKDVALSHATP
jgi:hypothetical protein